MFNIWGVSQVTDSLSEVRWLPNLLRQPMMHTNHPQEGHKEDSLRNLGSRMLNCVSVASLIQLP